MSVLGAHVHSLWLQASSQEQGSVREPVEEENDASQVADEEDDGEDLLEGQER